MANRFWVGGTGNWSDTAHWAGTSGGAGGVAGPTSSDVAVFDANSGTGTATVTAFAIARAIRCDGLASNPYTGTVNLANDLTLGDAVNCFYIFVAGMTLSGSATLVLNGSASVTNVLTGGKTIPSLNFNNAGCDITFGDNHVVSGAIIQQAGGLLFNGKNVTCGSLDSNNSNIRQLALGAGTITVTNSSGTMWNLSTTTNLSFSASTSTILLTGSSPIFQGGGLTYNNVTFQTGSGTKSLYGANTFANLTCTGVAGKTEWLSINDNQTVTGTLTLTGNSVLNRLLVRGANSTGRTGFNRTITAATVTASNVDLQDITGAGAASWNLAGITGNSGDAGGNSGITFTTAATQTWSGTSGGNWSANAWTSRVPLPQDDVVISAAFSASQTITLDMARSGKNVNFTGVTGSPAFTVNLTGITCSIFGSLTLAAGLGTLTLTTAYGMSGTGSHTITSAGKTWAGASAFQITTEGTYTLADNLTLSAGAFQVLGGTFDASTFNLSAATVAMGMFGAWATAPTVNMGSGTWSLTSTATTTVWTVNGPGSLTLNAQTSKIVLSTASANARTFSGAGQTYNVLRYTVAASTGALIITGANTFADLDVSGTSPHTVTLPSSTTTTITGNLILNGTPGSLTVLNSSTAGTAATISKTAGVIQPHYASIKDSTVTGGAVAEVIGGTLVSGNTGWTALAQAAFGMELGYAA